jgi:hypothetical protein
MELLRIPELAIDKSGQLQPLHCSRIARRAPLAEGGQACPGRAKGRERAQIRKVGGECSAGLDLKVEYDGANGWIEWQAGRCQGLERCRATGSSRCEGLLILERSC